MRLGLALGGRAEASLIRGGADQLLNVSAPFSACPRDHPGIRACWPEQGLLAARTTRLMLRRTVGRDGRSRAFVNDQPVSVGFLRSLGESLVEVHGQFETHGLLDPGTHITALDAYRRATVGSEPDQACADAWTVWRDAAAALRTAQETLAQAMQEEDLLRHNVTELDRLAPKPDEEAKLAASRGLLRHAEQIMAAVTEARGAIVDGTDVEGALRTAANKLSRVSGQAGGRLDPVLTARWSARAIEVGDAANELDRVTASFDVDPAELERAEERLFALKAAARKYGCAVADLPAVSGDATRERLAAIDGGASRVQVLATAEAETARPHGIRKSWAKTLSARRGRKPRRNWTSASPRNWRR